MAPQGSMAGFRRRLLYAAATSDRLEALVFRSATLRKRAFVHASAVVAGEEVTDALAVTRTLVDQGFAVSVDHFGENLDAPDKVTAVVDEYVELARAVSDTGGDVYLEVVPSHVGIDVSSDFFCRQVRRIAASLPPDARLEISAEESHRTPRIIDAELQLAAEGVPIVATLQANLRRTAADARRLADCGVPIRLVKGAYLEPPDKAHAWGEETDVAFVRLAHRLHEQGAGLTIATHDPVIREALLPVLDGVGVEMLLGVRSDDATDLLDRGCHVRIYVPYGTQWFRYWMRRVAESVGS